MHDLHREYPDDFDLSLELGRELLEQEEDIAVTGAAEGKRESV